MNQQQRKFLIEKVHETSRRQINELQEKKPQRPSLNNYLIAAFLDDSIEFNDIDALKEKMRASVLKFGPSDVLVKETGRYGRSFDDKDQHVQVKAEDLFVVPEAYKQALEAYEKETAAIKQEIDRLQGLRDTIEMKLQIGSPKILDKIIMQVDNLGDLDLTDTQLLLTSGNKD